MNFRDREKFGRIEKTLGLNYRITRLYANYLEHYNEIINKEMIDALCGDGEIFTGSNIENSAFSPTVCAERTAIFKAVSEGKSDFVKIAVVGGNADKEPENYCPPCGVCRQVMKEFCSADFEIIIAKNPDDYKVKTLCELLPESFDKREV